jgi:hypothetical protein
MATEAEMPEHRAENAPKKLSLYDRWQLWRIHHQIGVWPATVASFNRRHGYEWSGRQWVLKRPHSGRDANE